MKRITREWVRKAEADCRAARRESAARAYDLVCFLAQQAVEKYLKAILEEHTRAFPRTHDLGHLCSLAIPLCPRLKGLARRLSALSDAAVMFRYPGASANARRSRAAVGAALEARGVLRAALGLRERRRQRR